MIAHDSLASKFIGGTGQGAEAQGATKRPLQPGTRRGGKGWVRTGFRPQCESFGRVIAPNMLFMNISWAGDAQSTCVPEPEMLLVFVSYFASSAFCRRQCVQRI